MKRTNASRIPQFRFPILAAALAVALALFGGQATSWGATGVLPAQIVDSAGSRSSTAPRPAPELSSIEQSYAAREANAKGLENFKGGDLVIVGSGGLVIVLLIILILVII